MPFLHAITYRHGQSAANITAIPPSHLCRPFVRMWPIKVNFRPWVQISFALPEVVLEDPDPVPQFLPPYANQLGQSLSKTKVHVNLPRSLRGANRLNGLSMDETDTVCAAVDTAPRLFWRSWPASWLAVFPCDIRTQRYSKYTHPITHHVFRPSLAVPMMRTSTPNS